MKKDIEFLPVEGIKLAVIKKINELQATEWHVVLINQNENQIRNVFVTSKGYSSDETADENRQETSVMRHFYQEINSGDHVVLESIMPEVFPLNNEYWVSYYIGSQIFDKRFVFLPDSIIEDNLIMIDSLGLEGVLHD